MSITRSASGLANEYLFFRVDKVVYVEGGTTTRISDVLRGNYDVHSDDVRFWSMVLRVYLPSKRCKFKAVGSKSILKQIVSELQRSNAKQSIVCMDRDFDSFTNSLIQLPYVIYTMGYSWENDLWQPECVKEVFVFNCPGCPVEIDANAEIDTWFRQLKRDLRWYVYADFFFFLRGHSFQGLRGKSNRLITTGSNGCPNINTVQLRNDFMASRPVVGTKNRSVASVDLKTLLDCYGHFLDKIVYRYLTHLLKVRCSRKGTYAVEVIHSAAVQCLSTLLAKGTLRDLNQHYSRQFERI